VIMLSDICFALIALYVLIVTLFEICFVLIVLYVLTATLFVPLAYLAKGNGVRLPQ
jgi:hypothetical protein